MAYIDQVTFAGIEFSKCIELGRAAKCANHLHYLGNTATLYKKTPLGSLCGLFILYLVIPCKVVSQELSL